MLEKAESVSVNTTPPEEEKVRILRNDFESYSKAVTEIADDLDGVGDSLPDMRNVAEWACSKLNELLDEQEAAIDLTLDEVDKSPSWLRLAHQRDEDSEDGEQLPDDLRDLRIEIKQYEFRIEALELTIKALENLQFDDAESVIADEGRDLLASLEGEQNGDHVHWLDDEGDYLDELRDMLKKKAATV